MASTQDIIDVFAVNSKMLNEVLDIIREEMKNNPDTNNANNKFYYGLCSGLSIALRSSGEFIEGKQTISGINELVTNSLEKIFADTMNKKLDVGKLRDKIKKEHMQDQIYVR